MLQNVIKGESMKNTIVTSEQLEIYTHDIYTLVDDYIDQENSRDPEFINNPGFFPLLVQHIYTNFSKPNLPYKNKYTDEDIKIFDNLFKIYINLVYKYKLNKRPSLLEFCLFIGKDSSVFYNWLGNNGLNITTYQLDTVKRWQELCEQALIDDRDVVKSIFLLKSKHGYVEQAQRVDINVSNPAICTNDLPLLGSGKQD